MQVIGLRGDKYAGKSTVAGMLRLEAGGGADIEYSDIISEVATVWLRLMDWDLSWRLGEEHFLFLVDAMNKTLGKEFDRKELSDIAKAQPTSVHDPVIAYHAIAGTTDVVTRENKHDHNLLLQWIGALGRRITHRGVWADEMEKRLVRFEAEGHELTTVAGVRYLEDTEPIRRRFGIILHVAKEDVKDHEQNAYETERAQDEWHPDVVIVNDGSLNELREAVRLFWAEYTGAGKKFMKPRWRSVYTASEIAKV